MAAASWTLDQPLLRLSGSDHLTLRDACAGTHIFGATGSGKTSGSGDALAGALLRTGAGFLVCCAKPEEVELWRHRVAQHGRQNSLIVFDETQGFNFISYELARQGIDGIGSVIETMMHIVEAAKLSSASPGQNGDAFWQDSIRRVLAHALPILYAATGTVRITDIIGFLQDAPTDPQRFQEEEFRQRNLVFQTLKKADSNPAKKIEDTILEQCARYWLLEYPAIPAKTRGNIMASMAATFGRFTQGRLNRAFCQHTSIVPDLCFNGAIIVLAMPVLTWGPDGLLAQHLFKYLWQRVMEGRNALPSSFRERPVVLWCDEAQYFVSPTDGDFISTCRGSRIATVFLSQNLPTYRTKMPPGQEAAAIALVGKFNNHWFHANACPETNEFASSLIGRRLQQRENYSFGTGHNRNAGLNRGENTNWGANSNTGGSTGGQGSSSWGAGSSRGGGDSWGDNIGHGRSENESRGFSEAMDTLIEPSWFSHGLKTGGPANRGQVTGLFFKNSARFSDSGSNYLLTTFQQEGGA